MTAEARAAAEAAAEAAAQQLLQQEAAEQKEAEEKAAKAALKRAAKKKVRLSNRRRLTCMHAVHASFTNHAPCLCIDTLPNQYCVDSHHFCHVGSHHVQHNVQHMCGAAVLDEIAV